MEKPDHIYNVDETGFSKMVKREKVVTEKTRKHTYARKVSSTCHITANICVSAAGHVLPTFLIFENSFPSGSYRDGKLQTTCAKKFIQLPYQQIFTVHSHKRTNKVQAMDTINYIKK